MKISCFMVKSWLTHPTQVITRCPSESLPDPPAPSCREDPWGSSTSVGSSRGSPGKLPPAGAPHRASRTWARKGFNGWKLSVVDSLPLSYFYCIGNHYYKIINMVYHYYKPLLSVWTQDSWDSCQGPYQALSSASEVWLSIHVHGRSPSGFFYGGRCAWFLQYVAISKGIVHNIPK